MGFTTSFWQKERWSRRAADTLTSYGLCWNRSLANSPEDVIRVHLQSSEIVTVGGTGIMNIMPISATL